MRRCLPCFVAAVLLLASTASADPRWHRQPFAVSERPAAGLFLAAASNGDAGRGGGGGGEAGFEFDTPIVFGRRVRFDATRTSWYGQEGEGRYFIAADRITLTTLRVSLLSVRHHSPRVATYQGFGLGGYRFDYAQATVSHRWKKGIHYVAGVEFLQHNAHSAIDAEIRIHAMGGPEIPPESQLLMVKIDAAVGMKLRF